MRMLNKPRCLLKALEQAERLPAESEEAGGLLSVMEDSFAGETDEGLVLECGRCLRLFELRLVGGFALYKSNNDNPCAVREALSAET